MNTVSEATSIYFARYTTWDSYGRYLNRHFSKYECPGPYARGCHGSRCQVHLWGCVYTVTMGLKSLAGELTPSDSAACPDPSMDDSTRTVTQSPSLSAFDFGIWPRLDQAQIQVEFQSPGPRSVRDFLPNRRLRAIVYPIIPLDPAGVDFRPPAHPQQPMQGVHMQSCIGKIWKITC